MKKTKKMIDAMPWIIEVHDDDFEDYLAESKLKNPKEMKFLEWLWLHPSAYKTIICGSVGLACAIFLIIAILTYIKANLWFIPFGILSAYLGYLFLKSISIVQNEPMRTLFDCFLKEG